MGVAERRQREFLRRERDILDAALSLFNSDRWQSVTVEQIAEKAEIGKGTVYKHFSSKDEIYARLAVDFYRMQMKSLQQIDTRLDVIARLRAVVRRIWDAHMDHPVEHRLLQFVQRADFSHLLTPGVRKELDDISQDLENLYLDLLREGVEERVIADVPLPVLLRGASAAMTGATTILYRQRFDGETAAEYIEQISDFIVAGVTARQRQSDER
ncbi:MAG: TetR/AcrR family transcriptional regulator [Gemmatimonadota bacterium]